MKNTVVTAYEDLQIVCAGTGFRVISPVVEAGIKDAAKEALDRILITLRKHGVRIVTNAALFVVCLKAIEHFSNMASTDTASKIGNSVAWGLAFGSIWNCVNGVAAAVRTLSTPAKVDAERRLAKLKNELKAVEQKLGAKVS